MSDETIEYVNGAFFPTVELTLSNSTGSTASFKLNSVEDDRNNKDNGGMYVKDLTYSRASGTGAGNILQVNIYDNTAMGLEEKLSRNYRNLTFSYTGISVVGGYARINQHGPYSMLITNWSSTITPYGCQIALEAISVGLAHLTRSLKLDKDEDGNDIDCFVGPPHKVVEKIFEMCGLDWETNDQNGNPVSLIEETKSIQEIKKETDKQEKGEKTYKYGGGSALEFLTQQQGNITSPLQDAESVNENHKREYVLYYYDKLGNKNKPLGVFYSKDGFYDNPILTRMHNFSFEYNTKNSNIINWSPSFEGKNLLGISGVKLKYYDEKKKEEGEVKSTKYEEVDKDGNKPYEGVFRGTEAEAKRAADYFMQKRLYSAASATMTLLNYNSIEVGDFVKVKVITKDGTMHHTSGVWYVKGVSDGIKSGLITTKVELQLFKPLDEKDAAMNSIQDRYKISKEEIDELLDMKKESQKKLQEELQKTQEEKLENLNNALKTIKI